ncbi:MAG: dUTP diphosphatase [Bacteroidales bacterium]|nr:dUTP diphosphatase [Bacteroidales bacterium]
MKLRFKKNDTLAQTPTKAHATDAGFDMYVAKISIDEATNIVTYNTCISVEIPDGHVGLLFPRSSVYKTQQSLCNSVGVVDSGYRGDVQFKYYMRNRDVIYKVGEKCGQIMILPYPEVTFEEANELSSSDRGEGGFGSSGK